ncbi:MAG: hypothetical protein N3E36_01600 [Sulfolobales archaeon]|nr:hypothetical protein [Sulfolobales archaeon]MCX8198709.1 hypothetical protein [Sulfolobales archaeon]MDW8169782.1 hypothetical protein [Desulfurococcaceae archaeon]
MLQVFKLGFVLISVMILLAVVEPLLVFVTEAIGDPASIFSVNAIEALELNETHSLVKLELRYGGSVRLTDYVIRLAGGEVKLSEVVRGSYLIDLVVETSRLEEERLEVEFSVGGLYRVRTAIEGS